MENEEIKKTFLAAFERFYQDVGENWSRSKVENILKVFEAKGRKYNLSSIEIVKSLKELENEGWLKVAGNEDRYVILNKENFI